MPRFIDRNTYWQGFPVVPVFDGILLSHRQLDTVLAMIAAMLGGGVLLLVPTQIRGESISAITSIRSPAFFPVLGAILMCLVSFLFALRAIRPAATGMDAHEDISSAKGLKRAAIMGALISLYAVLVFVLGMMIASAVFIIGASLAFGYRRPWGIVALAVCAPVSVYLLFKKLLNVLLPTGWVF